MQPTGFSHANGYWNSGVNSLGVGAASLSSNFQEEAQLAPPLQEESITVNHAPAVPWWDAIIDSNIPQNGSGQRDQGPLESRSLEEDFPYLKQFDPSQWLDLLFPVPTDEQTESVPGLIDQTHSREENHPGYSAMESEQLLLPAGLSKRKFMHTESKPPLAKRVSVERQRLSAPPLPFPSQNSSSTQVHSLAPLPIAGRPPFTAVPNPTSYIWSSYTPASAPLFFGGMPRENSGQSPPSMPLISTMAAPAFTHLSTQMTQAFSHHAVNQIPVYEEARQRIQQALRPVLPLVEELDKLYEEVCKAFANGECPPKPEGMQSDLMPYQWRGYKWMDILRQFGLGGCLADGMGLGKTIQSIALVQAVINEKKAQGKTARILITCPANLVENWKRELTLHCPGLENQIDIIAGKQQDRSSNPICLISHQKLRLCSPLSEEDACFPFNQEWDLILLDEFHTFLKSKISERAITHLRQRAKGPQQGFIALTGTPMPNNLHELYRLNAMLNPETYPKIGKFTKAVMSPAKEALRKLLLSVQNNGGRIPSDLALDHIEEHVIQLIEILTKPFLLRRQNHFEEFKVQTAIMQSRGHAIQPLLPIEKEAKISYPFTEIQQHLIQTIIGRDLNKPEQATERGALSLFNSKIEKDDETSLNLIDYLYLQQVANHPSLLLESERLMRYLNAKNPPLHRRIQNISVDYSEPGKLQSIVHLVKDILDRTPEDKILIFTNFEKMGHLICEGLKRSTLSSLMQRVNFLYGKVDKKARSSMIEEFQRPNGPPVLIAGRKLGSVGWNCTAANHLIIVDPWWNPNDDDQCIARLHRIGQTKLVNVYRMHRNEFAADDKMDKLRIEKKAWCELILSADTTHVQKRIREIIEGTHSEEAVHSSSYFLEAGLDLRG